MILKPNEPTIAKIDWADFYLPGLFQFSMRFTVGDPDFGAQQIKTKSLVVGPVFDANDPHTTLPCRLIHGVLSTLEVHSWAELPGLTVRVRSSGFEVDEVGHLVKDKWLNFASIVAEFRLETKEQSHS